MCDSQKDMRLASLSALCESQMHLHDLHLGLSGATTLCSHPLPSFLLLLVEGNPGHSKKSKGIINHLVQLSAL